MNFHEAFQAFINGYRVTGFRYVDAGLPQNIFATVMENGYMIGATGGGCSGRDVTTTYIFDKDNNIVASESND